MSGRRAPIFHSFFTLTVAARKLPNYVRAISALACRARKQAMSNRMSGRRAPIFHSFFTLTVATRKLPKYVRAISALASRARKQAIVRTFPSLSLPGLVNSLQTPHDTSQPAALVNFG